jgi:opacity protein-like surface antigen
MGLKRPAMLVFLAVVVLCVGVSHASEGRATPTLSLAPSAGVAIESGLWTFWYQGAARAANLRTTSLAVDCTYGPMPFSPGTGLFVSAQVIRSVDHTGETALRFGFGTAKMRSSTTAGLLYAEVRSPARLSPFIRAGLGAGSVDIEEHYSNVHLPHIHMHYWGFSYAYGAGLYYALSPQFGISLCYEGVDVRGRHTAPRGEFDPNLVIGGWGGEWLVIRFYVVTL